MRKVKLVANGNGELLMDPRLGHPSFPAVEIRRLRKRNLHMTRAQFAKMLGVSAALVDSWECGRRNPQELIVKVLKLLRSGFLTAKTLETM